MLFQPLDKTNSMCLCIFSVCNNIHVFTVAKWLILVLQGTPTEHIEIGQPCLKCGPKCPGYMQHIWRYHHIEYIRVISIGMMLTVPMSSILYQGVHSENGVLIHLVPFWALWIWTYQLTIAQKIEKSVRFVLLDLHTKCSHLCGNI